MRLEFLEYAWIVITSANRSSYREGLYLSVTGVISNVLQYIPNFLVNLIRHSQTQVMSPQKKLQLYLKGIYIRIIFFPEPKEMLYLSVLCTKFCLCQFAIAVFVKSKHHWSSLFTNPDSVNSFLIHFLENTFRSFIQYRLLLMF